MARPSLVAQGITTPRSRGDTNTPQETFRGGENGSSKTHRRSRNGPGSGDPRFPREWHLIKNREYYPLGDEIGSDSLTAALIKCGQLQTRSAEPRALGRCLTPGHGRSPPCECAASRPAPVSP